MTQKVFSSVNFFIVSYKKEMRIVTFTEKSHMKIISLKIQNHEYKIHDKSDSDMAIEFVPL